MNLHDDGYIRETGNIVSTNRIKRTQKHNTITNKVNTTCTLQKLEVKKNRPSFSCEMT